MREFLAGIPLLSVVILLPLAGAVIMALVPPGRTRFHKWFAFWVAAAAFVLGLLLLPGVESFGEFSHQEQYQWIPQLGITYHIGVDGISVLLLLLSALLVPVSILASFREIKKRQKEFYMLLLIMGTALAGTFSSLDLVLFYVFWEGVLIPMYLLIGIWGSGRRIYAAMKFVLYTVVGSFLMLVAIIGLYVYSAHYGPGTFDFLRLREMSFPSGLQTWFFLAFTLAFAIKVPVFPFHTWLPDAHTEAPTAGSVLLAGVLLKMGTYGLIRFSIDLFPVAAVRFVPLMMGLGVIGIIYGALVCMVQCDLKRLIAYSSVAHMGFVVLGLFAFNVQGAVGAVIQMVNHGISTGALFLLVGMLYERRHTRELAAFGGLAQPMPVYFNFFLIVMLSSVGLPALNGFVGEFLILMGGVQADWLLGGIAVFGVVLAAVYLLYMFKQVFFGECTDPANRQLRDLSLREIAVLAPLVLMIFWIGLFPRPYLGVIEPVAAGTVERVQQHIYRTYESAALWKDSATMAVGGREYTFGVGGGG